MPSAATPAATTKAARCPRPDAASSCDTAAPPSAGLPAWWPRPDGGLQQRLEDFAHFQQVAALAGTYAQYHHWVATLQHHAQQPHTAQGWPVPLLPTQASGSAVTGTPVADVLAPPSATTTPAATPAASSSAALPPAPSGGSSRAAAPARWQSLLDVPLRLECARHVMALLQQQANAGGGAGAAAWARLRQRLDAQGAASSGGAAASGAEPALLGVVRAVEVHLYRAAPSREAYADPLTLQARVAAFVRGRLQQQQQQQQQARGGAPHARRCQRPLQQQQRQQQAPAGEAAGEAALQLPHE